MFRLSVPSKTFVVGEYAALQGVPALLLNTSPRFSLIASEREASQESQLTPVMKSLLPKFKLDKYHLQFVDPHKGRGGFGASGAELLLMVAFRRVLEKMELKPFSMLSEVEDVKNEIGWHLGSGYDVLSQTSGAATIIDRESQKIESSEWPFSDIGWVLLKGETKILTHEHLANLKNRNFDRLAQVSRQTAEAFLLREQDNFLVGVREFYSELVHLDLVNVNVRKRVDELRDIEGVLATKGCGALGADITLVLFEMNCKEQVLAKIKSHFEIIEANLSEGLAVEAFT